MVGSRGPGSVVRNPSQGKMAPSCSRQVNYQLSTPRKQTLWAGLTVIGPGSATWHSPLPRAMNLLAGQIWVMDTPLELGGRGGGGAVISIQIRRLRDEDRTGKGRSPQSMGE